MAYLFLTFEGSFSALMRNPFPFNVLKIPHTTSKILPKIFCLSIKVAKITGITSETFCQ